MRADIGNASVGVGARKAGTLQRLTEFREALIRQFLADVKLV